MTRAATATAADLVGVVGEHDGELVAAEPGDGVAVAQLVLQPLGEGAQQPVARLVAEGVVDLLEVVEVEEQERDGVAGAGARRAAPGRAGRRTARGWGGR